MTEAQILRDILLALGTRDDVLLWRNNVGTARDPSTGQVVHFGLRGSPDVIAIVAPLGRFVGIEVKSATGRLRPEQQNFQSRSSGLGAIYCVARSVDDALAAVARAKIR